MPKIDFRPAPFWSWNDELNNKELIRQVRWFKKRGFGGFFMHSRVGLSVPYLTEEWMAKINLCVEEAKRLNMQAWLYDEDRWPSGMSGGKVAALGEKYYNRRLVLVKNGSKRDFEVKLDEARPNFNGYPYVDLLNPEAVDKFIETTYEAYRKAVGKEFGKTIPGIFTDEATYHNFWAHLGEASVPWTVKLPQKFKKKYGYSLTPHLRLLFFKGKNYGQVRYDFWRLVSELFASSYTERLSRWCKKNNLILTGHLLAEDSLLSQTQTIGSAMLHYPHFDIPGVDHLFRRLNAEVCARQCSSIVHQLGKKRMLLESYGGSGWRTTLEEMRWIFDWQAVLGADFCCPHISTFSLRGCRKRDWPPFLSDQQPAESSFSKLSAHISKTSSFVNEGRLLRDILLIHPMATAWMRYSPRDLREVKELDKEFLRLSDNLSQLKHGYDYGDEILLERYGRVAGKNFIVGKARYRLVLVMKGTILSRNTRRLLKRFQARSGKVVFVRPDKSGLNKMLKRIRSAPIKISGDGGKVYLHTRTLKKSRRYLLFNTSSDKTYRTRITVEDKKLPLTFLPMQTHMVKFCRGEFEVLTPEQVGGRRIPLRGEWQIDNLDFNVLVLDRCSLKIEEGCWSKTMPVFLAQEKVCEYFSFPSNRRYNAIQPWLREDRKRILGKVALKFGFSLKDKVKNISLALESAENFALEINGERVKSKVRGYFIDRSFKKIPIGRYLKRGRNEIVLRSPRYREEIELENIYLTGDFQVRNETICRKRKLALGDWTRQGYPFYAGRMRYEKTIFLSGKNPLLLEVPRFAGMALQILVNGREAGVIWQRPYQVDITKYLKKGKNRVEIILFSSLRNLLGPLHYNVKDPERIWPYTYSDELHWSEAYVLIPQGLPGGVNLIRR